MELVGRLRRAALRRSRPGSGRARPFACRLRRAAERPVVRRDAAGPVRASPAARPDGHGRLAVQPAGDLGRRPRRPRGRGHLVCRYRTGRPGRLLPRPARLGGADPVADRLVPRRPAGLGSRRPARPGRRAARLGRARQARRPGDALPGHARRRRRDGRRPARAAAAMAQFGSPAPAASVYFIRDQATHRQAFRARMTERPQLMASDSDPIRGDLGDFPGHPAIRHPQPDYQPRHVTGR